MRMDQTGTQRFVTVVIDPTLALPFETSSAKKRAVSLRVTRLFFSHALACKCALLCVTNFCSFAFHKLVFTLNSKE